MKPCDTEGYRTTRRTRIQCGGSYPTPTVTNDDYSEALAGRTQISCGKLVRGDFKTPNDWSYDCFKTSGFSGESVSRSEYTDRNWTAVHYTGIVAWEQGESRNRFFGDLEFPSNALYERCLNKLNEQVRTTIDLTIDLAEAGQTVRMIRCLKRAEEFVQRFRKPFWRSLIRGAANARAEWAYGWSPLIGDIYGAADAMVRTCQNFVANYRVSVAERIPDKYVAFQVYDYGYMGAVVPRPGVHSVSMNLRLAPSGFDIGQWGSLNPVSLAWELIPYSFVVDWFLDVGGYLRNLETSLLYDNRFIDGYMSELLTTRSEISCSGAYSSGFWPTDSVVASYEASAKLSKFRRSVFHSYPVPRLPRFQADLSSGRLLNLAALIGQHLKGR